MWISRVATTCFCSLSTTLWAYKVTRSHVDNPSKPGKWVDRMWIKTYILWIVVKTASVVIPRTETVGISYAQKLGILLMLIHCFSNLWISYPHFLWITICFQKLYGKHQKTDPLANGWTAIRDLKNCWPANTFAHNNKVFHINCHFIHFMRFIRMSYNILIVMPYLQG